MPPPTLVDVASIDWTQVIADRDAIGLANPQRFEFALLDRVVYFDLDAMTAAACVEIRADDWWARGHIPGRPLFPGVLMIEAGAQLASYIFKNLYPKSGFLGFTGVDGVKFRGAVTPPCQLRLIGCGLSMKPRRLICRVQGFVETTMVFESQITGMPI